MVYLVLGFILGVAASWFWQKQLSAVPAFKQLMQKELAVHGQMGSVAVLKQRIELLEKKLAGMENSRQEGQGRELAPQVELIAAGASIPAEIERKPGPEKKAADRIGTRLKVLELWREGKAAPQIASETRLGQGEVELIIALQQKH